MWVLLWSDLATNRKPVGLVSKAIPGHLQSFWGYLHLSRSIIVAKTTSGFISGHIIRQYAHGLLLESPLIPSSTDCCVVRANIRQKRPPSVAVEPKPEVEIWRRPKKSSFWSWIHSFRQFFARTYRFATIQNVTYRQMTDRQTTQCTNGTTVSTVGQKDCKARGLTRGGCRGS